MSRIFFGDELRHIRRCGGCGKWFYPNRPDARTCSASCRESASRGTKCDEKRDKDDRRVLAIRPIHVADLHPKDAFTVVLPPDLIDKIKAHGELVVSVHDLKPTEPPPPHHAGCPQRRRAQVMLTVEPSESVTSHDLAAPAKPLTVA